VKKVLFHAILLLLVVVAIEFALRVGFASLMGPSVFFYGTSFHRRDLASPVERSLLLRNLYHRRLRGSGDKYHNVRRPELVAGRYSKYPPYEERYTYDADTGEVFRVGINGRGFRGPDFDDEKKPATVRVVTLGASSTFGYHDPDDGTYPAILERVLRERCRDGPDYEVINLGIPHLRSEEILALFLAEGLALHPDVVTFYEAINDSSPDEAEGDGSKPARHPRRWSKAAALWARDHFMLAFLVDEVITSRRLRFGAAEVESLAGRVPGRFVENVSRIADECRRRGIQFVVGKQQARSMLVPRESIKGITYAQEVALVRARLTEQGYVDKTELGFLIHDRVNAALEQWARESGVPLVDLVAALDGDRDVLVSWVHLNPRGNGLIADAFAGEILDRTCSTAPAGVATRPPGATDGG